MEFVVGPALILFYGCSFLYAVLCLYEKEQPRQANGFRIMARMNTPQGRHAFEQAVENAIRRAYANRRAQIQRRESGQFDWRKEGF
jgi:hypothetical protein